MGVHNKLVVNGVELDVEITTKGHKSSEGDGRTAADIEQELAQRQQDEESSQEVDSGSE